MKTAFLNIFFFSLVSIYVFATVGVCVVAHYCGGELEKVSLFSKPTSCCDGEDEETDGCCENDSKHVVMQSDFTFSKAEHQCKALITDLFIVQPSFLHFALQSNTSSFFLTKEKVHPPDLIQDHLVACSVIRV